MDSQPKPLVAGAVLAVALCAPFAFGPYGHYILCMVLIYAIVGLSLNIVLGIGGQISIGQAAFWAIGAYAAAIFVGRMGMPLVPGVLLGGAVASLFGVLVAMPALRVQGHYLAIATLGFSVVIQQILYEWDSVTGGRQGILVERPVLVGIMVETDFAFYYVILAFALVAAWLTANFKSSLNGLGLASLRMSPLAAQTCGIGRARHLVSAFALSAFLAGVSGGLYAHVIGQLSTDSFTITTSMGFLTMAVIGGMNSIAGAVLGGLFFALAPELLRELKDAQMLVYGVLLVLFMHFLPRGLAGIGASVRAFSSRSRA
ncbi:branched-chain amino acid ABC transporter permease [Xylophilus sp. GW821-FHT01B05]